MDEMPTTEQRIKAAMELAGLDWVGLAQRIDTPNYGDKTLKNIANPSYTSRVPSAGDLLLIGRACGVSEAFWTVDFRRLAEEDPSLRDELNDLRDRFDLLAAEVAAETATQVRALREHRERDHQTAASQDEAR